jgi:hypothetical protein
MQHLIHYGRLWQLFTIRVFVAMQTGRVLLPEVPTYVQGLFQETAGPCATYVLPIHLAVLHKNMELVRYACMMPVTRSGVNVFALDLLPRTANLIKVPLASVKAASKS